MNKFLYVALIIFFPLCLLSQSEIDHIPDKICNEAKKYKFRDHNAVIQFFIREIRSFGLDSAGNAKVFIRLQRVCNMFTEAIHSEVPNFGDWELVKSKPISKISKDESDDFYEHGSFYYKEPTGDHVHVEVTEQTWDETFPDETVSNLDLVRLSKSAFKLVFKSSNNGIRKNLSIKGEEYFYELVEVVEDGFLVSLAVKDSPDFYTFKMYKKYKM